MAYEFATYEKKGGIAVVMVNCPERMNASTPRPTFEPDEIWNDSESDPEVWIGILTGAGDKAFSAGNELRDTAKHGMNMVQSPTRVPGASPPDDPPGSPSSPPSTATRWGAARDGAGLRHHHRRRSRSRRLPEPRVGVTAGGAESPAP